MNTYFHFILKSFLRQQNLNLYILTRRILFFSWTFHSTLNEITLFSFDISLSFVSSDFEYEMP